jgi:hypothetical protein
MAIRLGFWPPWIERWWAGSYDLAMTTCPACGFQLASARSQARCERRAARIRCPVCHENP